MGRKPEFPTTRLPIHTNQHGKTASRPVHPEIIMVIEISL